MAYTAPIVWELVFMMVVLKLPIAYLCFVVYWAVKAEPKPPEASRKNAAEPPEPRSPWRPRPARPGPRRGPERTPARARRAPLAR
ncbi:MAG TPA: hypothetical protein VKB10_05210 [Gaiellaceae bacterium]|nr:hypothetical protein [Gaiellaceae bacterium]